VFEARVSGLYACFPRYGRWINSKVERRGFNKAVVALADKNARIARRIVADEARYEPGQVLGSA